MNICIFDILVSKWLKWHNAFSYASGNLDIRCECMTWIFRKKNMVSNGISQDDFSENGVGRRSNRSFRMRTMTVSGSSPTHSPRRVVPYFYRNSVVYFQEQQVLF